MADAVEIYAVGDLQNGKIRCAEKIAGEFHLDFRKIGNDRFPRKFLKILQKHGRRVMRHGIDVLDRIGKRFRLV